MERAELRKIVEVIPGARCVGDFVFLSDPHWTPAQLDTVTALSASAKHTPADSGWLCVPTGGTSGSLRFARHDEITLSSAVSGFSLHFDAPRINTVGLLPSHHVSGLMSRVRCAATGGRYLRADWKAVAAGEWPEVPAGDDWFISLVPTQLQRLLQVSGGVDFLRRFKVVMLGGGPLWDVLAEDATAARLPLVLTYGLTETAAMVCAQKPEDFARGERDAGRPLAHAKIVLIDEATGRPSRPRQAGQIQIEAASVMRGYFPHVRLDSTILSEDLGEFTARGTLRVIGRRDAVIITGGKKVWPETVEAALRATGLFGDVAVIGVADAKWGQMVVACYPAGGLANLDEGKIKQHLESTLPGYQHPKRYVAIEDWPRNDQGKVNRAKLRLAL